MPAERTNEAKTRSRLGCLTCRSRHKKCDETRLDEHRGACRRCFVGSWECKWPTPAGETPLRNFVSGSARARAQAAAAGINGDYGADAGDGEGGRERSKSTSAAAEGEGARAAVRSAALLTAAAQGDAVMAGDAALSTGPLTQDGAIPVEGYNPAFPAAINPVPAPFAFPAANGVAAESPFTAFTNGGVTPAALPPAFSATHPSLAVPSQPTQAPTTPNAFADLDVLAPASSFSSFLMPGTSGALDLGEGLTDFFHTLDAEVGYWESLGAGSGGSAGAASVNGSAVEERSPIMYANAGHTPQATGDVDAYSHPRAEPPAAQQKAPSAAPTAKTTSVQATPPIAAQPAPLAAAPAGEKNGGDLPLRDSLSQPLKKVKHRAFKEARMNVDDSEPVDPIYNTFNDGFFRSLPKPVRDVVVQRTYNIVGSTELSRHAAMAMVMLYRLRMQQQAQQTSTEPVSAEQVSATAEQHARLLAQSDHYFQKALEHLQGPIPFEAKMVAVLDMQTYQFDQWGAAASNAILLLGEYFIHEALGSQPAIDLSDMQDPKNVLLSAVAWSDCIRCICIPRRRTIFAFSGLPGEPSATTPEAVVTDVSGHSDSIDAHLGLPLGLLLCVAATANLAAEMDALPDEVVRVKAAAIENATREWKPAPPNIEDLADSAWYIDKLSTAEMWRHAVIIFLYQVVYKHGMLSRIIREAMQQILQLGSRMLQHYRAPLASVPTVSAPGASSTATSTSSTPAPPQRAKETGSSLTVPYDDYHSSPSMRAVPWFLAGTCALLPGDRALCRRGIEACGKQQGFRDNIAALERLWEVMDEKGWCPDWRALLQDEKRFVGFL